MHAGRLRERITIRRPVNTKNHRGGIDRSWQTLAQDLSAEVVSLNGRESMIGQAFQGISSFQITIRYRDDVQQSYQILSRGRELNIHSAEDREGTRQWLVIMASTEGQQGA